MTLVLGGGRIMDSILISVKKMLGITADYTHFDDDIIMHINSVFMILHQLGVGPEEGFMIESDRETWDEFIKNEFTIESVKSYMYLKVGLLFDPPTSSNVMEAKNRLANELEWRLNTAVDNKLTECIDYSDKIC